LGRGATSKNFSYWWEWLGTRELVSIKKEVSAEIVGSEYPIRKEFPLTPSFPIIATNTG
jgi:hypothetical protein